MGLLHQSSSEQYRSAVPAGVIVSGTHSHSVSKLSLKIAGPLLLVGVCSAVAVASTNSHTPASPLENGDQNTSATAPGVSSSLNVDSQSTATNQPSASDPTASTNTASGGASNTSTSTTQVTVNGQPVAVPANGSVQKTVVSPDGTTSLNVSSSNQGDSNNSSYTSTNLSVSSSSWSNTSGGSFTTNNGTTTWGSP